MQTPILMQDGSGRDCHYAVIGTTCNITYEQAKAAFWPLPAVY